MLFTTKTLSLEIQNALNNLVHSEGDLNEKDYVGWEMRIAEFPRRIKTGQDEGSLNADQYEALRKGMRELRAELEFFHPKQKRKRTRGSA